MVLQGTPLLCLVQVGLDAQAPGDAQGRPPQVPKEPLNLSLAMRGGSPGRAVPQERRRTSSAVEQSFLS